jgi:Ca2+-binding EF-hand superfamily protein
MGKAFEDTARRRFNRFDADGSGEISLEELKTCIQSMDDLVTSAEIEQMFEACDIDGNGSISFEEFMTMTAAVLAQNMTSIPC